MVLITYQTFSLSTGEWGFPKGHGEPTDANPLVS